jgi:hypothetical protein
MDVEVLKDTIRQELPGLLREDPELRNYLTELMKTEFADKTETRDRFYDLLAELRRNREERARELDAQNLKWKEQNRKWDEQKAEENKKWEEQDSKWNEQKAEENIKWEEQNRKWNEQKAEENKKWEEQNRKWDEQNHRLEEQNRKWDEQKAEENKKWEEQNARWEANQKELQRMNDALIAMVHKHDRSIGALGSRWGLQSERAFRNALAGILEKSFGVQVLNVIEFDYEGTVFGRPDQVELDVIIKNGVLIICELKSSIDKAGMYIFERKVRYYERKHDRKASRMMVISPMIDARAQRVADILGIETYGDSIDVESL